MFVRKKRFVRRRSSSGESSILWATHVTDGYAYNQLVKITKLFLILAVVVSLPIVGYALKPLQVTLFRVDPEVYDALLRNQSATVYVAVRGDTPLNRKILKTWHFGDLHIYKTVVSSTDELYSLTDRKNVISIYGDKTLRHALYLNGIKAEEYPFKERDIDNEFHRATGPWIGRGVTVAIIDSGIDYTHPDFFDDDGKSIIKVLVSLFYISESTGEYIFWEPYKNGTMNDLLNCDMLLWEKYGEPAFLDINGHGTHVAGIIAGRGHASNGKFMGIAPGVQLVVVKAFNKDGVADMDMCLEALEWVYNNTEKYDIEILNISWGANFASDGNDPLSLAVDELSEEKGVWVFAAAGNEGNIPTTIVVPAVARKAFAVGAWDPYYDKLASFSSLGPTIDMRMKPDLVVAGVMIVSCKSQFADFPDEYEVNTYYVALSGTSMATPVASGIAATFIEYFRYWHGRDPSVDDFIRWVKENSRHIDFIKDFITGWGIPKAPHG